MEISIRPLKFEDASAIERLYNQSAEYLRSLGDETEFQFNAQSYQRDGFGQNPAFAGFCALLGEQIVGYLIYTFSYDTDKASRYLFVLDLLVDQQLRQKGIGKTLMQYALDHCRASGGRELFWAVYYKNEAALKFYAQLGAEEIADLRFMRLKV